MIYLSDISSKDLAKLLKLVQRKEVLEGQMLKIIQDAQKRKPGPNAIVRNLRLPRKAQPSLREMISGILQEAGKPMSVAEIYEASIAGGYHWLSKDPMNALNVKMYTDESFKKVEPGRFVVRKQ